MPTRNIWIASLAALVLSCGMIGGMLAMRWGAIVQAAMPPPQEEHFDPVTPVYWDRYFTHLYEMQKELKGMRDELDQREETLDDMREQLDRREAELAERARQLKRTRDDIRQWFVSYGAAERANYQRIAKTYAAMEPDKVVPILLATPSEEVAKVLLEMKPETVAPIWTAILDASAQTESNATRVSRLIELMGRVHNELKEPPEAPPPATTPGTGSAQAQPTAADPDGQRFNDREIENFRRVAKTYEAMDPTKVAPILLATSPRDAAGVLLQMRPENVASIWSAIIEASRQTDGATEKVVAMAEVMRRNRNGV